MSLPKKKSKYAWQHEAIEQRVEVARLQAINDELVEALEKLKNHADSCYDEGIQKKHPKPAFIRGITTLAIAKAKGSRTLGA